MFKINFHNLRIALIFAIIILNSGYALSLGRKTEIMLISIVFIVGDMLFTGNKLKLTGKAMLFLVFIIAQFAVTIVANMDVSGVVEYVRLFVIFVLCYYLYVSFKFEEYINGFCDLMYFLSLISLAFYAWISIFPSLAFRVENGYGTSYLTCFLSFINVKSPERNSGIFWEPSVFSAMCFAWGMLEICVIRKLHQRKLRTIVLLATILTTYSTSGYIYLLFLVVFYLLRNDNEKYSPYRTFLAIVLVSTGLLIYFNFDSILVKLVNVNPLVFKKLMENNASVTDRAIGPLADMYVALKNPFGIGLSNLTATVEDVAREIFKTPIFTRTSTITFYFAAFGWISGIVVVLSLLNFTKKIAHSLLLRLVMFAGIIFMSISTPMNDSAIFITLLFLGLHENISENNTELITIT